MHGMLHEYVAAKLMSINAKTKEKIMKQPGSQCVLFATGGLIALTCVISCSKHVEPPYEALSRAQMSIQQAEQKNAVTYAPLELKLAQEKLVKAQTAMKEKDYGLANRWSQQATVDAELAQSKSGAEESKKTVGEMRKGIGSLKKETSRNVDAVSEETPGN
jgi:hypothetical protein